MPPFWTAISVAFWCHLMRAPRKHSEYIHPGSSGAISGGRPATASAPSAPSCRGEPSSGAFEPGTARARGTW
eukprot:8455275-Alexandrium_andersonii.AAC.1